MKIDARKIKITEKALEYLNKKGKTHLTIGYPDHRINGDFAVVPIPEIYPKKPKNETEYYMINKDGIEIYISRMVYMPVDNDIIIDVNSFLKMNFLILKGFSINNQ